MKLLNYIFDMGLLYEINYEEYYIFNWLIYQCKYILYQDFNFF